MTFTAIVWSKEQFVTWRCAACLLSRKDCSVMKKINGNKYAEQPRPPAPNKNKTNLRVNLEFVLFFTRD